MIVSIGIFYLFGKIIPPPRFITFLSALGLSGCVLAIGMLLGWKITL
jgi:hypothetical protein